MLRHLPRRVPAGAGMRRACSGGGVHVFGAPRALARARGVGSLDPRRGVVSYAWESRLLVALRCTCRSLFWPWLAHLIPRRMPCIRVLQQVLYMPCKHEFHANCVEAWLRKVNTCPSCRHELEPAPLAAPPPPDLGTRIVLSLCPCTREGSGRKQRCTCHLLSLLVCCRGPPWPGDMLAA